MTTKAVKSRKVCLACLALCGCWTTEGACANSLGPSSPLALHQVVVVSPGGDAVIRLPGYDLDGDQLSAEITSLPETGTLHQLSRIFSDYGYEPAAGERIGTSGVKVTGSNNRVVYKRPRADAEPRGRWDSFTYTVSDGSASAKDATVTLVSQGRMIVAADFETGVGTWQVCQSGGTRCDAARYDASSRGLISFFVSGTDSIIHSDATGVDDTLWWFKAGTEFSGNLGVAYDGTLEFSLGAFSGTFSEANLNGEALRIAELYCSACDRNTGMTLAFPLSTAGGFAGGSVGVSYALPLSESKGWVKDPNNSLKEATVPTKCEMAQVLSNLSELRILGDFTRWYESVALDSVYIRLASSGTSGGSNSALPVCAQGSPNAFVCTC